MKKYTSLILAISLFACEQDNPTPHRIIDLEAGVDLIDPAVGEISAYLMYSSNCDGNFKFTGDTLMIEVVSRNDSLFLHEYYSSGSMLESDVEHVIIPLSEYVLIPHRFDSQMLFFYGNDTIFTSPLNRVPLRQNQCRLDINDQAFIGNEIGSVDQFRFRQIEINDVTAVSCVPGFFDLDAYIFYKTHLSAVHIIRSDQSVVGFVAID